MGGTGRGKEKRKDGWRRGKTEGESIKEGGGKDGRRRSWRRDGGRAKNEENEPQRGTV
jgi:hypothetical protein